tara:strand:- start:1840 stop:2589 length:750 start_codon:yes stop_codon:yes gene_type:complete
MPRFVLYNIEYGEGFTGHWYNYLAFWKTLQSSNTQDLTKFLKQLHPDILGIIEIDAGSMRTHHHSMIEHFKKSLKLKHVTAKEKYKPHSLISSLPIFKKQFNALLTHYPSSNPDYLYLKNGVKRLVIKSTINTPTPITVFLVHLSLTKHSREHQIEELEKMLEETKPPMIVAGDFNTFYAPGELFGLMKHLNLKKADDDGKTFPSFNPKKALDHILVSKEIKVKKISIPRIQLSDHRPVIMDFEVQKKS